MTDLRSRICHQTGFAICHWHGPKLCCVWEFQPSSARHISDRSTGCIIVDTLARALLRLNVLCQSFKKNRGFFIEDRQITVSLMDDVQVPGVHRSASWGLSDRVSVARSKGPRSGLPYSFCQMLAGPMMATSAPTITAATAMDARNDMRNLGCFCLLAAVRTGDVKDLAGIGINGNIN